MTSPNASTSTSTSTRNINHLVRANFFAQLADQLSLTAIPLIAVLYLELGAGSVGLLNTFQTLPYFILSIPLGVLVDRVSKKGVMLATEGIRVSALLGIIVLIYFDMVTFWSLTALGCLAALGSVGFNAALPAYVPTLIEKSALSFYNGRLEMMRSLGMTMGPAMAGAMAARYGASNTFVLGLILTGMTMAFVANISHNGKIEASRDTKTNPLHNIAEGAAFIFQNRQLSTIMMVAFVWNCGWFALMAAFMPLAINSWGLTAEIVGYALSCMGVGFMLGSFFSQRIINAFGFGASLAFGPVISFLAAMLMLANTAYESAILAAIAFFFFGFGPVIWVITSNTLRQLITPAHMIGCVSAMYMTTNWGARPFGALIGAGVGAAYGEIMCLVASAILFFAQMMLVFVTGLMRSRLETSKAV